MKTGCTYLLLLFIEGLLCKQMFFLLIPIISSACSFSGELREGIAFSSMAWDGFGGNTRPCMLSEGHPFTVLKLETTPWLAYTCTVPLWGLHRRLNEQYETSMLFSFCASLRAHLPVRTL